MNKEIRFLNYLENKIKICKDWAINSLIVFLPTFIVCCVKFPKLLEFKTIFILVGIALSVDTCIGIVCIVNYFKTKKCEKIVEQILEIFPVGKISEKNLNVDLKGIDNLIYCLYNSYSKNGTIRFSIEDNEKNDFTNLIIFRVYTALKDGEDWLSRIECDDLSAMKKLRDFLLN